MVREMREQADHLDQTADRYSEHDALASKQVTVA